ncbi:hypothetical protein P5W99_10045 [Paraburkholderia sp. A3BS-1L]|uniref:hypothetical protein n=1 Tax=Paraburkholderia sp. A3BS-1L TaxID=3028375 RepID=UPI003DAA160D
MQKIKAPRGALFLFFTNVYVCDYMGNPYRFIQGRKSRASRSGKAQHSWHGFCWFFLRCSRDGAARERRLSLDREKHTMNNDIAACKPWPGRAWNIRSKLVDDALMKLEQRSARTTPRIGTDRLMDEAARGTVAAALDEAACLQHGGSTA